MPSMGAFLKVISVALEYGMLAILLFFMVKTIQMIAGDARRQLRSLERPERQIEEAILSVLEDQSGKLAGKRFAFSDTLTIGRGTGNSIVISDAVVSHHHAVITAYGNQYVIEDLGSRNHTYVNDKKLTGKQYLKNGDFIRIGFVLMRFER